MRRALPFLIMVLIGLAACRGDDARAPFTDSRIPPGLDHRSYPPQGWAWGLIQVGKAPPVRYGVAGPARRPIGHVIILPGYGETAEAWFETANDLIGRGYAVWVLEGSGQAGSGRAALPRDVVHARSLDPDVAAVIILATRITRDRPRFLLAAGMSTPIAARAAALGLELDGMVLIQSTLAAPPDPGVARTTTTRPGEEDSTAHALRMVGLGHLRRPGGQGWRREDRLDEYMSSSESSHVHWLSRQWQRANPDLRMGDPSVGWSYAYAQEVAAANAAWPRVRARTLAIGADICRGLASCSRIPDPSTTVTAASADGEAFHRAFVAAILGFIEPGGAALAPAPSGVTVDPEG